MRVPMWLEKHGRTVWNGRDNRGHFDTVDRVAEARFRGEDAPLCPHACCNGRRPHPAGLPVMKKRKAGASSSRKAAPRKKRPNRFGSNELGRRASQPAQRKAAGGRDYAAYLHGQYLAAEKATRGNMVTKAGRARGYTGSDFFKAGARPSVEKWGTDELRAWFGSGNVASSGRGQRVLTRSQWDAQQKRAA